MFAYEDAVRDATALLNAVGLDDVQFTGETEQFNGETWLPFTTQYYDQPTVVVDSEGNVRLEPWTYLIYPEAALETKATRYVRTPEGRRRYGQEIGTLIVRDIIPHHPWMQRGSEAARRVAQRREQRRQRIDAFSGKPEEYRGGHQAAGRDFGSPMYDPEDMMPDLLTHPEYYRLYGEPEVDAECMAAIRRAVRGGPDTKITVYRAVPKGVDKINPGDWVTPSKTYAKIHAEANLGGTHDPDTGHWVPNPSDILSMEVRAGDLWFEGNSIAEWGWAPEGTDAFTKMERLGPVRRFNRWLSQPGGGRVPRFLPHNLPVPKAPTHTSERYTPSIRFPGWDVYTIQGHPVRVWELDDGRITAFAPDLDFEELESPVFEGTTVDEALQGFIDHMREKVSVPVDARRVRFESRLIEADKVHELPEQDGVTVRWIEVANPTLGAPMFDDEGNQVASGYFVPRRGMIGTSDNDQIEVRAVFGVPARGRLGEYAVWVTGQRGEIPSQLAEMQKRYARTKPGLVKRTRVPVDETFRKEDLYHETSDEWVNGLQRAGITQAQWEHMVLVEGTVSTGVPSTRTRGYVNAVMGHYKRKYGSISPLVGKVRITNETINGYDNDYAAFNRDDAFTSPIHGTRASSINLNTRYFPAEGHSETNARHLIHLDSLENEHTSFSSVDVPAVAKHLGITEQDAYALTVMHHEVGHAISNLLLGDNEQFVDGLPRNVRLIMEATRIAMWQMLDKVAMNDFMGMKTLDPERATRNVSGYGAKNLHEHMAEIWAAYNLMPQVTKYEQQLGRMMDETFKIIAANLPPDPTPEEST